MNQLFVKKLTVIDFSYLDSDRGLLGESWLVDIQLTGSLDHQGMVLDFSDVKKKVKKLIDDEFDHKLVIPALNPGSHTEIQGKRLLNQFTTSDNRLIEHIAPESAYCFLDTDKVSPESLGAAIIARLSSQLPDNVEKVVLKLYPETITGDYYHYSHGLKHHGGNCQRIAHGHRSRIEIFEAGMRNETLEHEWARQWKDIYIGTESDVHERISRNGVDYIRFRYTACQGLFELTLPASNCYLVEIDSTVENLAQHIADRLHRQYPDKNLTVYAYEGIDKGAISSTP
jgi:6-pyruvoyl-tetrahydropterin synthase